MPEAKFNFSPESLNIPGADYKGVRTFALQARHVAASNYFLWSPVTGDKIPDDYRGGNGPEALKTKAEILKFLKDSFARGHKAAATLTAQNMLETPKNSKSTRLHLATFAVASCLRSLRTDGGVPAHERNRPAGQPMKTGMARI
jgi:hypothetical protein